MYDLLKKLFPIAEEIGTVFAVDMVTNNVHLGNRIEIEGVTENGRSFELRLTVEVGKNENP